MTPIQTVIDIVPGVVSADTYRAKLQGRLRDGKILGVQKPRNETELLRIERGLRQPEPLQAEIDCGRWVTTCPCGGGVALHPAWQYAACMVCGRSWIAVLFPDGDFLQQIDKVLSLRPPGTRRNSPVRWYSWWKGETVDDLIRQNRRHGWPVPESA